MLICKRGFTPTPTKLLTLITRCKTPFTETYIIQMIHTYNLGYTHTHTHILYDVLYVVPVVQCTLQSLFHYYCIHCKIIWLKGKMYIFKIITLII